MTNQYCKVGASTPITSGERAITVLEFRQQYFLEKARSASLGNPSLREFFERKAAAIQRVLENF